MNDLIPDLKEKGQWTAQLGAKYEEDYEPFAAAFTALEYAFEGASRFDNVSTCRMDLYQAPEGASGFRTAFRVHIYSSDFADWCERNERELADSTHRDLIDDLFMGWGDADEISSTILEITYFHSPSERAEEEDVAAYYVLISFQGRTDDW